MVCANCGYDMCVSQECADALANEVDTESEASNWPGGIVQESIGDWISKQDWSDAVKANARSMVDRCDARGLNYPLVAQWRTWAAREMDKESESGSVGTTWKAVWP